MRLRALIVDDEAPARTDLRYLLQAHPDVEVVGEAASAREALQLMGALGYDVVFCDIEMAGPSGLQVAELLRDRPGSPAVVFVTAYERYAVAAFAVEAFDYVLKPVDPERLAHVIARLKEARRATSAPVEKLPVVSGDKTAFVPYDAIHFVRADGDYTRIHTHDRSFLCTSSLHELEERLPRERFVRIHRSYLVNVANVAAVGRAGADRLRVIVDDEARTELDVARRQSKAVRERLRL